MSVPGTVRRYIALSAFLTRVSLRRLVTYRVDFLIGASAFIVRSLLQAMLLAVIFGHVTEIGGWTFHEMLFLLGFAMITRGLDHMFTDQLWELARKLVQRGEFYRYLIRPANPLFLLLSERFMYPDGIGDVLAGLLVSGYAIHQLNLSPSPGLIGAGVLLAVCGALVYSSVKLVLASLAFWTTTSLPTMTAVYQLGDVSSYPMNIFPWPVVSLLTWVLPYAFTAYIPATYLLHGETRYAVWAPAAALGCCAAAALVWHRGLARYEMTGA